LGSDRGILSRLWFELTSNTSLRGLLGSVPQKLLLFLLLGGVVRLWLSYSTGGFDVRCWFDSVKILSSSNFFSFYRLAYPKPAEYEYPPIWMLLLTLVALGYRMGWYTSELSPTFRFLVKLPIIVCDLAVALVIFLQVRRWVSDEDRALISAVAWLFNPFVIYVSSIQGMFDSICVLFLLLTVYTVEKRSFLRSGLWFSLALLTKQYAYLAVLPLLAVFLKRRSLRGALLLFMTSALMFVIFSLPFLVESPLEYVASVSCASRLETSLCTRYQYFGGFFFSGIWYLLDKAFHLPSGAFYLYKPAIISSMFLLTALCYLNGERLTALTDALLGSNMVFTLVGLMINSQYLVFPMAFSAVDIGIHRRCYIWFMPELILSTYFPLRGMDYAPLGRRIYGLLVSVTMVSWTITHLTAVFMRPTRMALHSLLAGLSRSMARKKNIP